jgi:diacylglycerol kinase (ATP)
MAARGRSILYALEGLRFLVRNEHNAWIHALVSLSVVGAGGILQISANDWRWIVVSIGLVWIGEALNTAVEQLCNLVSPQPHPLIKASKDVAAGAVLICAVTAAIIGGLTFYPYFGDEAGLICGGYGAE